MKKETQNRLSVIGSRIERDIRQYGSGILVVAVLYLGMHVLFDAFCPSVLLSGFPCPGCGMTRAVLYLFRGQFQRSWALNPAAFLWVAWALLFALERYIKGKKSRVSGWALCGIGLFMIIVYLIRMKMYFPNKPPYVYTGSNLFSRLLPGYGELVKYLIGR